MANIKFSQFTQKTTLGTVDFLVGYTGADNIQIDPVDLLSGYPTGSGGTGRVAFWEPSNNLSSDYLFKWDNSSNRLGLGVETPTATLHAVTADDTIAKFESSDNKAAISISDDDTTGYFSAENGRIGLGTGLGASSSNISILTSNSNVGIGTVSPSAKLEVDGTFISTGISQIGSGGSNVYLTSSSAGNVGVGTSSPNNKLEVKGAIGIQRTTNTATSNINMEGNFNFVADTGYSHRFEQNGTEVARIDPNGNLGVGTTSPDAKVDIDVGSSSLSMRFQKTGQETYRLNHGTSGLYFTKPNSNALAYGVTQNSDFDIFDASGNVMFRADSSTSRVGVGTSSPSEKLEISGGKVKIDQPNEALIIDASANQGSYIVLSNAGTAYAYIGAANQIITAGTNTQLGLRSENDMLFATNGLTERMRITDGGNVGIGTTSPTEKLQINSGDVLINNSTISSLKSGGSLYIDLNTFGSYSGRNFRILDNGTSLVNVKQTGEVGIGTTSPSYPFDVFNTDAPSDIIARFKTNDNSTYIQLVSAGSSWQIGATSDSLDWYNDNNSVVRMSLLETGSLGIGTTSPGRDLQVGDGSSDSVIAIVGPGAGLSQLALGTTVDDNYAQILLDNSSDKLQIQNGGGGTLADRGITLDSSEKVGIGTMSPSENLQIGAGTGNHTVLIQSQTSLYKATTTGTGEAALYLADGNQDWRIQKKNNEDNLTIRNETTGSDAIVIDSATNKVGIGTHLPASKLEVDGGDIEVDDSGSGLILKSPDGTRYRVTVANGGTLSVSAV